MTVFFAQALLRMFMEFAEMKNPNASPALKRGFGLSSFGRSAEVRTLGLVVPNFRCRYFIVFYSAKIKEYQRYLFRRYPPFSIPV